MKIECMIKDKVCGENSCIFMHIDLKRKPRAIKGARLGKMVARKNMDVYGSVWCVTVFRLTRSNESTFKA